MATKKAVLALEVSYDDQLTDPEALTAALDRLMDTALSTPGILEEYGEVEVGAFHVERRGPKDWRPGQA